MVEPPPCQHLVRAEVPHTQCRNAEGIEAEVGKHPLLEFQLGESPETEPEKAHVPASFQM